MIAGEAVKDGTQEEDEDDEPMDLESSEIELELDSDLLSMLRSGFRRADELRQKSVSFVLFKTLSFES